MCRGCRLHFKLRPACLLPAERLTPLHGLLTPRSGMRVSPPTWGLLPGAPTLTGVGLTPTEEAQPVTIPSARVASVLVTSRRTMRSILPFPSPLSVLADALRAAARASCAGAHPLAG